MKEFKEKKNIKLCSAIVTLGGKWCFLDHYIGLVYPVC